MSSLCRTCRWTRRLLCLLTALAATLPALATGATTVVRMDDAELVDGAALIVTGECLDTSSSRLGGRIVTLATVRLTGVLKGSTGGIAVGSDLTVVLPGGVDPSPPLPVAEVWPGAPELVPHQVALLFLQPFRPLPGSWSIVGYSQGMFTLAPAAAGSGVEARRDLHGVDLLQSDGSTAAGGGRGEPLAYWRRLVDELAAGEEAR